MARPVALSARRIAYATATVAAVGATVLAARKLDVGALASVTPAWVAAALALNCASMLLRALAWFAMLRTALPSERIGAARVVRATMIGVLGSAVAPGRAGEPLRTWVIARGLAKRERLATVIGTLVTQTALNVVALGVLALVALPAGFRLGGKETVLIAVGWPVVVAALIALAARLAPRGRVASALQGLRAGLTVFRPRRRGAAITLLQLCAWGLQTLAAYALLLALDIPVPAPLATAAAILVAVNVTAAVPVTPSNVGIFQAACIGVLATVGVSSRLGLSYGLLLQAAEVATALVLGLPAAVAEGVMGSARRR